MIFININQQKFNICGYFFLKMAITNNCAHIDAVKNGKDLNDRQRYKCNECGRSFTDESIENPELRRKKRLTTQLLLLGYSPGQIKSTMPVSESEIDLWSKKYLPKLEDVKREGKLINVNYAYGYLSALDSGKRPKRRINKNKPASRKPKLGAKKSTRKKS